MTETHADLVARVAELEAAQAQAQSSLRLVHALERIGAIGRQHVELDAFLQDLLDEFLTLFGCDRAWLLHPCDPDAPFWSVPMERAVAQWPGVAALGVQIPMDEGAAAIFRDALAADGPLTFDDTTERSVPEDIGKAFSVRAQILVAVHPHVGPPWVLGLHHCGSDHVWTDEEVRLFAAVAERVGDLLDSLLLLRDLQLRERAVNELQRTEAIGRLASGIAHDFNNQLLVILCHADLLQQELADAQDDPVSPIVSAAEKAADLTRQLLAFSRRALLEPRPVDLRPMIESTAALQSSAVGRNIRLEHQLANGPLVAHVDPAGLEQVLLNLLTNARDAVERGGTVTVAADVYDSPTDDPARPASLGPGRWVRLSVQDDGSGMSDAVRQRVLEPFFTTKARGAGTGLGLSTADGFLRQSGGALAVESTEGVGSRFTAWLPPGDSHPEARPDRRTRVGGGRGDEVILLVEPLLEARDVAAQVLRRRGYTVHTAADGAEAMAALRAHPEIQLLLTEVDLGGDDGVDLARRALAERPSLRVSFATGYSHQTVERLRDSGAVRRLLQKPYSPEALAGHVRALLDDRADRAGSA